MTIILRLRLSQVRGSFFNDCHAALQNISVSVRYTCNVFFIRIAFLGLSKCHPLRNKYKSTSVRAKYNFTWESNAI